jgi:polyisoprenoid-binding protein YceI
VSLEAAVEAVTSSTAAGGPETTDTEPAATDAEPETTDTTAPTTTSAPVPVGIAGEWSARSDGSLFVGYRVNEELAGIGVTTAAGRTPLVAGALSIDGTMVMAVEIEADLTGLESDDSRRDGAIRSQALETDTFPTASFSLTRPIELPAGADSGAPVSVTGVGDLTLHGVTREIEIPLEAQLVDGAIVVIGSTTILFEDYEIEQPRAAVVLSVEDQGIMEFQLVFDPAG